TPANASAYLLEKGRVEVLTGINLPLLLETLNLRVSSSLPEVVQSYRNLVGQGFKVLSEVLQN
ncbi:MAG: PTS fructose transporter subunit IIA, partial [Halanaerobium sp.]|nr:PTS fructose transporter subunit IIA [Halanaerobium sp.]